MLQYLNARQHVRRSVERILMQLINYIYIDKTRMGTLRKVRYVVVIPHFVCIVCCRGLKAMIRLYLSTWGPYSTQLSIIIVGRSIFNSTLHNYSREYIIDSVPSLLIIHLQRKCDLFLGWITFWASLTIWVNLESWGILDLFPDAFSFISMSTCFQFLWIIALLREKPIAPLHFFPLLLPAHHTHDPTVHNAHTLPYHIFHFIFNSKSNVKAPFVNA